MKLLTVEKIEKTREKLAVYKKKWLEKTETVSLNNAVGRVLAQDIFSPCDIPSFNRSTVDGYALKANETSGACESVPVFFKYTGFVSMGKPAKSIIQSGECVYVPTGAMLPDGADAVVMIEYCEKTGDFISVYNAAAAGSGTVMAGEDFQKGNLLLKSGTFIRAQEIGALSAAGILEINVFVPLAVCIISTGDELAAPEKEPALGEIRDVNTSALKALAIKHGFNVVSTTVLGDDEIELENAVRKTVTLCDIVIISGGSSKGEKDFTAKIIDRIAKPGIFTNGLAVKPGKPTILGWDEEKKTLFAGLPGHPVSAMMTFELLFGSEYTGRKTSFPVTAFISCNVPGSPGKAVCLPVVLSLERGFYRAEPVFGKSAVISTLTRADGYVIIDLNKEGLKKDEPVLVHLF